jgi:putative ABC transport system substrate-binding protein
VIVTPCGPIIGAIRRLDRAMPVVFRSVDTETCAGEIADLDRPGGYTTGALYFSPDAVGRRLEVLKALVPGLSRVGVLHRPASEWAAHWAGADAAAAGMGLSLYRVEWRRNRLLSEAIDQAVSAGVGALLTFGDGYIFARRLEIFALAADRKLPVLYDFPIPPTAFERGLVSYAVDIRTLFRHVAEQVDRILQGDKPGDIPVARPRRFRLIIDHGAARALGLRVPRALLLRDRLLEHVEDVSALRARAHSPRD